MSPHDPGNFLVYRELAAAHYFAGNYSEAISFGHKAVQQRPGFVGCHNFYIVSLARVGQLDEARAALGRLKELQPELSLTWLEQNTPLTAGPMRKFIDDMRIAGLQ